MSACKWHHPAPANLANIHRGISRHPPTSLVISSRPHVVHQARQSCPQNHHPHHPKQPRWTKQRRKTHSPNPHRQSHHTQPNSANHPSKPQQNPVHRRLPHLQAIRDQPALPAKIGLLPHQSSLTHRPRPRIPASRKLNIHAPGSQWMKHFFPIPYLNQETSPAHRPAPVSARLTFQFLKARHITPSIFLRLPRTLQTQLYQPQTPSLVTSPTSSLSDLSDLVS